MNDLPCSNDAEAVRRLVNPSSKTPICLWAFPGVGKTAWLEAAAKTLGMKFHRVCPAEQSPDEVGVVCAADPVDLEACKRLLPTWWLKASREPWFILIDEVTAASEDQLIAVMRATDNEREMGGVKLHEGSIIALAANQPECAAGRQREMPLPLLSRLRHVTIDHNGAVRWMLAQGGWISRVGAYLHANPKAALASAENLKSAYAEQKPFACPRAWTRAAQDCQDRADEYPAYIGADAAAGWAAFLSMGDLPCPDAILSGNCHDVPSRGDAVLATSAAVCGMMNEKSDKERWIHWANWHGKAADAGHAGHLAGEVEECIQRNKPACMAEIGGMLMPYVSTLSGARKAKTEKPKKTIDEIQNESVRNVGLQSSGNPHGLAGYSGKLVEEAQARQDAMDYLKQQVQPHKKSWAEKFLP